MIGFKGRIYIVLLAIIHWKTKWTLRLTQILPEGHEVYNDNFFTYELLDALIDNGLLALNVSQTGRGILKRFAVKKTCLTNLFPTKFVVKIS